MSRRITPIFLVALAACATMSRAPRSHSRQIGTFAYQATIAGREEIGTFTIDPDTVKIEADDEMCRGQRQLIQYPAGPYAFDCSGAPGLHSLRISVNVEEPYMSSWVASITVTRTRRTCVEFYPATGSAPPVCKLYITEPYQADSSFYGRLRVKLVTQP
ncbi:MAG TPA: hypothetical protein VIV65_03710 [Gemmatimonadaceae bacterium]